MGKPEISVVVPVYNPGAYFADCVESILAQTFKNFELLLVDDGSTDGSSQACDEFAARDSRVRVIHKANEGISATRRRGVQEAKGEWIAFADDDDTLTEDALESLYNLTDGTDIVSGFSSVPTKQLSSDASLEECRRALIAGKIEVAPWGKLYRRSLLTDDVFNYQNGVAGEDMIMNIRLFFKIFTPPIFYTSTSTTTAAIRLASRMVSVRRSTRRGYSTVRSTVRYLRR